MLETRIRGAVLLVRKPLPVIASTQPFRFRESITGKLNELSFQSGAVTLPLSGNEGRCALVFCRHISTLDSLAVMVQRIKFRKEQGRVETAECQLAFFKGARQKIQSAVDCNSLRNASCRHSASILDSSRLYLSAERRSYSSPALTAHLSTGDRQESRSSLLASSNPMLLSLKAGEKVGVYVDGLRKRRRLVVQGTYSSRN